jgi:hypothetical protein
VVGGPTTGRQITLDEDFVIGRGESGMGNLGGDSEISRRHARFRELTTGEILVEDLGSTNGTHVNGQRISAPVVLSPGDRVTVGRTTLQLEGDVAAAPVAAPVATPPVASAPTPVAGPLPQLQRASPPPAAEASQGSRLPLLALAGLVLLGIGLGIGLLVNGDSGKSVTTVSTLPDRAGNVAAATPTGLQDPSNFSCVGDRNGTAGPGHFRFITSGCENSTSTIAQLPLQRGTSKGKTVWYVVTDSSNAADARARHVNFAPKLANGVGSEGVQDATINHGTVDFPATVDFTPKRVLAPGPKGFPPAKASPPAVGQPGYSPLVKLPNGIVINAPQVANSSGHADKALALDTGQGSVLYQETEGRYEDKHVHYASFESGNPVAATIEDVTFAPALNTLPKAGDFGLKTSAREQLVAFVNGPTGLANPGRQGENSTILDNADPHNILKEVPVLPLHSDIGDPAYTPAWDVHFGEWTPKAIASGARVELQSTDEVDLRVSMKLVTGPGGATFGPSKFTVNCPLISIDVP